MITLGPSLGHPTLSSQSRFVNSLPGQRLPFTYPSLGHLIQPHNVQGMTIGTMPSDGWIPPTRALAPNKLHPALALPLRYVHMTPPSPSPTLLSLYSATPARNLHVTRYKPPRAQLWLRLPVGRPNGIRECENPLLVCVLEASPQASLGD